MDAYNGTVIPFFVTSILTIIFVIWQCKQRRNVSLNVSKFRVITERLKPNEDLAIGLESIVRRERITACNVVSCVGSLTSAELRMANLNHSIKRDQHFEIVSLTGTLGWDEKTDKVTRHLHICLSDCTGACWGGHVLSSSNQINGNPIHRLPIYTTAEICLLIQNDVTFSRKNCNFTWSSFLDMVHRNGK
eukprot:593615_1